MSVAIHIDPLVEEDPTDVSQEQEFGQSVGVSQREAPWPSSGPSAGDPLVWNRARGFDMSAVARDLFEEFQRFKLLLEVRRLVELAIDAEHELPPSSAQGNRTTSVKIIAHDHGVDVPDRVPAEANQAPRYFVRSRKPGSSPHTSRHWHKPCWPQANRLMLIWLQHTFPQ